MLFIIHVEARRKPAIIHSSEDEDDEANAMDVDNESSQPNHRRIHQKPIHEDKDSGSESAAKTDEDSLGEDDLNQDLANLDNIALKKQIASEVI